MNANERAEYKPKCNRCGEPVTDIDWLDISTLAQPDLATPGYMRCSTDGCYNAKGSRITSPLVPGGLTLADNTWLRWMERLAHEKGITTTRTA